jgi:methyl-accepting chemotaxis protein
MLRGDTNYVDKFIQEASHLGQLLRVAAVDDERPVQLALKVYLARFIDLVDAEKIKGLNYKQGLMGEMRKTVHQTEVLFSQLQTEIQDVISTGIELGHARLVLAMAAISIISALFVALVSMSIYRPLIEFSKSLVDISKNKDLKARLIYKNTDEIGRIATAFNQLFDAFQETISKVSKAANQTESSSKSLEGSSAQVDLDSDAQTAEVLQVVTAMDEMVATIQGIARNASMAAETVGHVREQVKGGVEVGDAAKSEIVQLNVEVQEAVVAIKELEKNSENISEVLDAIQSVAEQTNLLALNAAIEAARAGEQGRGFAVVADEVRTLAQRTQESTIRIRETIDLLQKGTRNVVDTVTRSSGRAELGIERVASTSAVLIEIFERMEHMNDVNLQVATAAEQQSATAEEINRNVNRIAELSRDVKLQTNSVAQESSTLSGLGRSLKSTVGEFKV